MRYTSIITTKGQITIPKFFRNMMGFKPQQVVSFERQNNRLIVDLIPNFLTLGGAVKSSKRAVSQRVLRKQMQREIVQDVVRTMK